MQVNAVCPFRGHKTFMFAKDDGKGSASTWRVAAMRYAGAAAREPDRGLRLHLLWCASDCLDMADRLTGSKPPPGGRSASRPRYDA